MKFISVMYIGIHGWMTMNWSSNGFILYFNLKLKENIYVYYIKISSMCLHVLFVNNICHNENLVYNFKILMLVFRFISIECIFFCVRVWYSPRFHAARSHAETLYSHSLCWHCLFELCEIKCEKCPVQTVY